ncbi:hypothetical protein [Marinobacter subterrani]|uniref:hypothetical protein n=1 Tax=Marinobacter subterrani TaxID=1658765 RepID=UPI002353F94C|nr:hypothetical protein [Marinobacter subterrani]
MLEQIYDIFERTLTNRNYLATLKLTSRLESGKWEFIVLRQLNSGTGPSDREIGGANASEILYVSSHIHSAQPNVARITDITNSALEGFGLNSWLIHKARQAFFPISGPDPWLSGDLTEVDADNPRRVPFWQRHIDAPVSADEKGNGRFRGPWISGYNSARRTFAATLQTSHGQAPVVPADHGYNLYELDGRLALKKLTPYQAMNNGRSGKPVWQM